MLIKSDWHIHSNCSYDAKLTLDEIARSAKENGIERFGITDHVNFNDIKFGDDLINSVKTVGEFQKTHPQIVLGVELTPINKAEFDYIAKHKTRDGYTSDLSKSQMGIELAKSKEELESLGVRYAVAGAHWRIDIPASKDNADDVYSSAKEWYRQQMWLACDERVTILAHPWYHGNGIWYDDFSVIPRSMNMDIASALKENKKYVECNEGVLCANTTTEKFRNQYAEFLRELFEMGIPITYGSDSHIVYAAKRLETERLLSSVGFREGDFSDITEVIF